MAAPSQKAALKAWGTTTDLFGAGRASVVEDPALQAEALARPGEVIKRLRGDEAEMLGPEPSETRPRTAGKRGKPAGAVEKRQAPPPLPDRSELDAAETSLRDAERGLADEIREIAAERAELERREAGLRAEGEAEVDRLRHTRDEKRRAYEQAVAVHRRRFGLAG